MVVVDRAAERAGPSHQVEAMVIGPYRTACPTPATTPLQPALDVATFRWFAAAYLLRPWRVAVLIGRNIANALCSVPAVRRRLSCESVTTARWYFVPMPWWFGLVGINEHGRLAFGEWEGHEDGVFAFGRCPARQPYANYTDDELRTIVHRNVRDGFWVMREAGRAHRAICTCEVYPARNNQAATHASARDGYR